MADEGRVMSGLPFIFGLIYQGIYCPLSPNAGSFPSGIGLLGTSRNTLTLGGLTVSWWWLFTIQVSEVGRLACRGFILVGLTAYRTRMQVPNACKQRQLF